MGYVFCMGYCVCCRQQFSFNPVRVPSTRALTGEKEPVCRNCMNIINIKREEQGMEPFAIHDDAYEPCDEYEL
jgi:hypothetical protein